MRSISFWRSVDGRFNKITIKIVSFLIGFNNIAGTFECVYPDWSRVHRLCLSHSASRNPDAPTDRLSISFWCAAVKILATNEPTTGENQMIYRKTN